MTLAWGKTEVALAVKLSLTSAAVLEVLENFLICHTSTLTVSLSVGNLGYICLCCVEPACSYRPFLKELKPFPWSHEAL